MVPFLVPQQTTLDANGDGVATYTARVPVQINHTRVQVTPPPGQTATTRRARALVYACGWPLEGTYSGSNDQSDTRHVLLPGETLECRWTGGDPGATATLIVRGVSRSDLR
ncbi:hypothetical protein C5N14_30890 [Micromonospora sp. MW-13]|uniref:hypothetical protein n=1 Tax=Micromonospora sp. MW-13 TaxID=2094022 RepID=UPI000EC2445F|nr:hypothetical protein [Micromonospora sp. MW-13]RGC65000.1 hypothetical protein C5N14_30890 [Micromonospora sp. MW-13]